MSGLARYMAGRIALMVPTVLAASIVVFAAIRVIPGDPVLSILSGSPHTEAMRESLRKELGLDRALPEQYARWLLSMIDGGFGGKSLETREPIGQLLARQLPVTLLLAGYAVLLSLLVSLPLGVAAAVWKDRWPDILIRAGTVGGLSIPTVWLSLLILLLLLRVLRWSPPVIYSRLLEDPWNHAQMMLWPTLALCWEYSSQLVRVTRGSVLEALGKDFVTVARSKGLSEPAVVLKYVVRSALLPPVTMVGLQFGTLASGALVLETVFGLPGMGRGIVQAALARDYPVVQSYATLLVLLYLVVNLVIDGIYGAIDPRVTQAQ